MSAFRFKFCQRAFVCWLQESVVRTYSQNYFMFGFLCRQILLVQSIFIWGFKKVFMFKYCIYPYSNNRIFETWLDLFYAGRGTWVLQCPSGCDHSCSVPDTAVVFIVVNSGSLFVPRFSAGWTNAFLQPWSTGFKTVFRLQAYNSLQQESYTNALSWCPEDLPKCVCSYTFYSLKYDSEPSALLNRSMLGS